MNQSPESLFFAEEIALWYTQPGEPSREWKGDQVSSSAAYPLEPLQVLVYFIVVLPRLEGCMAFGIFNAKRLFRCF
jgi:hypothetical protein